MKVSAEKHSFSLGAMGLSAKRRWFVNGSLVLAVFVVACFGYYWWDQRRRAQSLAVAQAAIDCCDFAAANAQLQQCLRDWPSDAEFHFLMAQVCRRQADEDFADAAKHLAQAAPRWPKAAIDREYLLIDFQASGPASGREPELRQLANARPPEEKLVLEALVRGSLNTGRVWAAHYWLSRWVERYPDDWRAYRWRGALLEAMGQDPHLAAADYLRVLQMRPNDDSVRLHVGLALVAYGYDLNAAIGHLEAYCAKRPDDLDAVVGIARCYRELSRPADAQRLLEKALQANPRHPAGLLTMALVASDLEQDARAWVLLEQLQPLLAQQDDAESMKAVQRGELPPPHAFGVRQRTTIYHQAARVLRRLGREEAAREFERGLERLTKDQSP